MSYTAIHNKILFSELSDTAIRMYMVMKHLVESNPNYEITRSDMEYEWKKLKNKTSQRTFIRAWRELQDSGLLYKYDVKHGGAEGFGCRWRLRTIKQTTKKETKSSTSSEDHVSEEVNFNESVIQNVK